MERTLVVNADDFGMTPGVSRGIARAHDEGIVTSASLLAGMPGFDEAVRLARALPALGVGLHLNLTDGAPVLPPAQIPTLVDSDGRFLGYRSLTLRMLSGRVRKDELKAEITAQLGRLEQAGIEPTHIDGHRHVHLLPTLFDVVADAAVAAGIKYLRCPAALGEKARPTGIKAARALGLAGFGRLHYGRLTDRGLQTADCFLGAMSAGQENELAEAAERLPELPSGITEWMVHPGEVDSTLMFVHDLLWPREAQLRWLCSDDAHRAVEEAGLRLANFRGEPKLQLVKQRSVA